MSDKPTGTRATFAQPEIRFIGVVVLATGIPQPPKTSRTGEE